MENYETVFASSPVASAHAPGRVNLLGEHTDYNGGFVLPIGTRQVTRVEIGPSADQRFHAFAANLGEKAEFSRGETPSQGFQRYIAGCVAVLEGVGIVLPPFSIRVESNVPIGVGLSSSAALEVALLRAIRKWRQLALSDVDLALHAQRAEIEYAGVRCGIMDQMASSLGDREHMLFLDTRSLAYRRLPLPAGSEVLILESGVSRELAATVYNLRREECEKAASLLHIDSLRDIDSLAVIAALPFPLNRRARHVVTENRRVIAALEASPTKFGQLMDESHASLRDDYEVSCPALDALTECLRREPAVYGARLTGAGFGGACVALARLGEGLPAAASALARYSALGFKGGRPL